jgi:hypothetical protein
MAKFKYAVARAECGHVSWVIVAVRTEAESFAINGGLEIIALSCCKLVLICSRIATTEFIVSLTGLQTRGTFTRGTFAGLVLARLGLARPVGFARTIRLARVVFAGLVLARLGLARPIGFARTIGLAGLVGLLGFPARSVLTLSSPVGADTSAIDEILAVLAELFA